MIEQLTILAPGLLGGSIARAARAKSAARTIAVWARRPEVRVSLKGLSWCDSTPDTPEAAVAGAQLVVIASPVDAIVPLIRQIAPHLKSGAVVTDVGSVKGPISRDGHDALAGRGGTVHFVGSHPMAGSEKTGWENGFSTLFENRACFVTPLPETDPAALDTVWRFWEALGARVARMSPQAHDDVVAHISHLPQLLASTLCAFLADKDPSWRDYAGGGLRDTTRIASSDPELWRAILAANRGPALSALQGFQTQLAACEQALSAGDWVALSRMMALGKTYRDRLPR